MAFDCWRSSCTKKVEGLGAVLKKALRDKHSEPLSAAARAGRRRSLCYLDMPTLSPEDDPLQWWKVEAK